ncbi:MAG: DUF4097 family beta strand repeat-containing protein [Wenzhouxiangellaceae bacterium]
MRTIITSGLLLMLSASVMAASYDESRPASATSNIRFEGIDGELRVEPWDRDEWRLSGELSAQVEEVEISGDSQSWSISLEYRRGGWQNWGRGGGHTDLTLNVPRSASLGVKLVSADLTVGELDGEHLRLETVSGRIIADATAREVEIQSVSGDIRLRAGGSTETRLESVSGDIEVGEVSGRLKVQAVSGDIEIRSARLHKADFETVSGDLEINAELAAESDLELSSHSGDIELNINDVPLDLEVETFSGGISSDWGKVEREKHGPGKSLNYRQGSGTAKVNINAFSGDVRVRQR